MIRHTELSLSASTERGRSRIWRGGRTRKRVGRRCRMRRRKGRRGRKRRRKRRRSSRTRRRKKGVVTVNAVRSRVGHLCLNVFLAVLP
jgi:hypothetical protein